MAKAKKTVRKKARLGHFDHEKFMKDLAKRIKTTRKDKGFTSSEGFAYDIEISRNGMRSYESGEFNDIQLSTLLKIIDGLEMKPSEFFAKGFD